MAEKKFRTNLCRVLKNHGYSHIIYCVQKTRGEAASIISDETVYRRYLDGKENAANLLLKKHGDAQTQYINGYIKDIHEAEDLMIETFAQIFAKERPISSEGSFKAYLYKTTRNLSLRYKEDSTDEL